MSTPKIKFKKIKDFLKNLPHTLGARAFLTFLGLLFLSLIFGGFVFYKYSILIEKETPQIITPEELNQFNKKTYEEVVKIWQEKEKRFESSESKEYPDPFK